MEPKRVLAFKHPSHCNDFKPSGDARNLVVKFWSWDAIYLFENLGKYYATWGEGDRGVFETAGPTRRSRQYFLTRLLLYLQDHSPWNRSEIYSAGKIRGYQDYRGAMGINTVSLRTWAKIMQLGARVLLTGGRRVFETAEPTRLSRQCFLTRLI